MGEYSLSLNRHGDDLTRGLAPTLTISGNKINCHLAGIRNVIRKI